MLCPISVVVPESDTLVPFESMMLWDIIVFEASAFTVIPFDVLRLITLEAIIVCVGLMPADAWRIIPCLPFELIMLLDTSIRLHPDSVMPSVAFDDTLFSVKIASSVVPMSMPLSDAPDELN